MVAFQPARNDKRLTECDPRNGVATLCNSNVRACFHIAGLVYYTIGYMCKQGRSSTDFKEVMSLVRSTDFASTSRSALGVITKLYMDAAGKADISAHAAMQFLLDLYQYKTSRDYVVVFNMDGDGDAHQFERSAT